jgi:hypothetical protein
MIGMYKLRLSAVLAVGALGIGGTIGTLTGGALKHTFLGDIQVVSYAQAASPAAAFASVVNEADNELAQLEQPTLTWQLTESRFVPLMTQVVDPTGLVIYDTSQPINAWVLRLTAMPQCGNAVFHALVVVNDDTLRVVNASSLATPVTPNASGCPNTPLNQDPPSVVPGTTLFSTSQQLPVQLPVPIPEGPLAAKTASPTLAANPCPPAVCGQGLLP